MGTNFYTELFQPCKGCGRPFEQLHIGKSSGGWQFYFAPYPVYGLVSWAAWHLYLIDKKITDQNGQEVSLDDFVALVNSKQTGKNFETAPATVSGIDPRNWQLYEYVDAEGYRFACTANFT